ncbi:MAG: hypothetical protein KUG82_04890 [Pseudomonadales bacterium]|nr:hypothetical protein [Pseudomonadales bacterium]
MQAFVFFGILTLITVGGGVLTINAIDDPEEVAVDRVPVVEVVPCEGESCNGQAHASDPEVAPLPDAQ